MTFNEAVNKLNTTYGLKIFFEPFKARSILSDYVGNDFKSKRLIDAYYYLFLETNFISELSTNGVSKTRIYLKDYILRANQEVLIKEYKEMVDVFSLMIKPDEFNKLAKKSKKKVVEEGIIKVKKKGKVLNKTRTIINPIKHDSSFNGFNKLLNHLVANVDPFDNVKKVYIDGNSKNLTIAYSKDKHVRIYIDNKIDYYLIKRAVFKNDTVKISFFDPDKDYKILLPKRDYDLVDLKLKNSNLSIDSSEDKRFTAKKLLIENDTGDSYIDAKANKLSMMINHGFINISGIYKNILTYSNVGDVTLILYKEKLKEMAISVITNKGNIDGVFLDYKLKNKINHGRIFKTPILNFSNEDDFNLYLHLQSPRGRIRFQ